jgi:L-fuconolactonase
LRRRPSDISSDKRANGGSLSDVTNPYARASYRECVTHFTEELDFLSEEEKDWVMGRAILERLGWS